jgi:heptosyltransferase-2
LIQNVGVRVTCRQPELYTTARGEQAAASVWKQLGWNDFQPVIGLNTGGAYGAAKHWPNQHAGQLALRLAEAGQRVLVMCGPNEVSAAREIESLAGHRLVRSMANHDLSLETSKSCIRRLQVLVTTDSGPRHIASAFDVPTVTLFGPIDPRWSYNYASFGIEMFDQLECSPCGKRTCPLVHHRCMRELTSDRVLGAVKTLQRRVEAA